MAEVLGKPIIPLKLDQADWPPVGPEGPIRQLRTTEAGPVIYIAFPEGENRWKNEKKFSELQCQLLRYIDVSSLNLRQTVKEEWFGQ